jgi:hypothetical protein
MKAKNFFGLFSLILVIILSAVFQGCASLPVSPPGTEPIITNAFLSKEEGRYGDILKIYIEAEDPQGYMHKIYTWVDQPGYGRYFPDRIFIKPEDQHHLIGYLQWNTFSSRAFRMPEWTQITIKVSISDTSGNESNTVVFPFTFVSEAVPERTLPPPFNQGNIPRLGYVHIDLINPFEIKGVDRSERWQDY